MFNFIDDNVTKGVYKPIRRQQTNQQGQGLVNPDGSPVTRLFHMVTSPVISRFLGAREADPINVTGTLYAQKPDGSIKAFDLDRAWGYLTLTEVLEIYLAAMKNDACKAVHVQTLRFGPESAVLCNLSGTEESRAVATKYGLQHQVRSQTLADGTIVQAGAMEVVITDAAIAAAMTRKVFKGFGRFEGLTGPVDQGSKANDHLSVIVATIAATGSLPTKVVVPTATQVARQHDGAAFEDMLDDSVAAPALSGARNGNRF